MSAADLRQKLIDRYLEGRDLRMSTVEESIRPRAQGQLVPTSLAQEQIWRRSVRVKAHPSLCNESITIHRQGPLDVRVLRQSLTEILRRHEAWRTSLDVADGIPVQVIHPAPIEAEIPVVDLSADAASARESKALQLTSALAQRPFDLQGGPLWRALLIEMGCASYRLSIIAHQSIVDGISALQILPAELVSLYEAYSAGKPSPLGELPIQYGDFSLWQKGWLTGKERRRQVEYWKTNLAAPIPILTWPLDSRNDAGESYRGAILPFALSAELKPGLEDLGIREGVTLFMVLVGGFVAVLHRYSGERDLVVATLSPAGRKHSETQALLGYFLNPVALRFDLRGEPTFSELLAQARGVISDAISNDDVPMENLIEELNLGARSDSITDIAISMQPRTPPLASGWDVTTMDAQNGGSRWHLYLEFMDREEGLLGRAQYNPDVLSENAVAAVLEDLQELLREAVADPRTRVRDLKPRLAGRAPSGSGLPQIHNEQQWML
jgi:surfactin family lipopeptide synthetase A